jgi:hypothetical protein
MQGKPIASISAAELDYSDPLCYQTFVASWTFSRGALIACSMTRAGAKWLLNSRRAAVSDGIQHFLLTHLLSLLATSFPASQRDAMHELMRRSRGRGQLSADGVNG